MNPETIVILILFLLFTVRSVRNWNEISFFLPPLFNAGKYDIRKVRIVTFALSAFFMAGLVIIDVFLSEGYAALVLVCLCLWPCCILFCRKSNKSFRVK